MARWSKYENFLSVNNVGNLVQKWSYDTGAAVFSPPVMINGKVYAGSGNGNVYALNANTGTELWSFQTGNAVYSSPAVEHGVVYVVSYGNYVYALDVETGAELSTLPCMR